MIRINNESTIDVYESDVFSHPIQTGTNGVEYNFNHNRGKVPDVIKLYRDHPGTTVKSIIADIFQSSSNGYLNNWETQPHITTLNTQSVKVCRLTGVAVNIKFKLFWL